MASRVLEHRSDRFHPGTLSGGRVMRLTVAEEYIANLACLLKRPVTGANDHFDQLVWVYQAVKLHVISPHFCRIPSYRGSITRTTGRVSDLITILSLVLTGCVTVLSFDLV
jgi:hypothetical protein